MTQTTKPKDMPHVQLSPLSRPDQRPYPVSDDLKELRRKKKRAEAILAQRELDRLEHQWDEQEYYK